MIDLNTDKGFVRVETWADVEGRPSFVGNLNPAVHTLEKIIGRYAFKDKIRCGLSDCHTPHRKGYIVVTKEGPETNIGHECGKAYFGVDFKAQSRQFDRDYTAQENRQRLWSFFFQVDALKARMSALRSGAVGADWVYKTSRALIDKNQHCPLEVVHRIADMVKARRNALTKERKMDEQEIEAREAISGQTLKRPQYVDEQIATISGLEALYPENDLKEILVLNLERKIKEFETVDIDALSYDSLRDWAKWIDTVESTMDQANRIVVQGQRLLQAHNLRPITQVLTQKDSSLFRNFLKGLPE